MSAQRRRQWTAEPKLQIREGARQSDASVSEVCRRHDIGSGQFYKWEQLARAGALDRLLTQKRGRKESATVTRLKDEVQSLRSDRRTEYRESRARKGALAIGSYRRYRTEEKALILDTVHKVQDQGEQSMGMILSSEPLRRPPEPDHPDQVWHIDLRYVWVASRWY